MSSQAQDGQPGGPAGNGEDQRRGFLKIVTGWLSALLAAAVIAPGAALLGHPIRRDTIKGAKEPLKVGKLAEIKPGQPVRVDVKGELVDAWSRMPGVKLGSCWLVKASAEAPVKAFSTVCPHLGCGIDWDTADRRFVCPCHKSYFGIDGQMLEGPSPRGLDELEVVPQGNDVKVVYRKFRVGLSKKEEI